MELCFFPLSFTGSLDLKLPRLCPLVVPSSSAIRLSRSVQFVYLACRCLIAFVIVIVKKEKVERSGKIVKEKGRGMGI